MTENNRPGQMALQNMKLLTNESSVFKVPKLPKKKLIKKKTKVLDEDFYAEGIANLIQRDFFPDLEKLNAQNEFLEATENKDFAKLREIYRKYNGRRPSTEPYNSPATFDTPDVNRLCSPCEPTEKEQGTKQDNSTNKNKQKSIIDNHTLDSFLAKYTSEDNASYDRVIALEEKKKSSKLSAQFLAEVTSAQLAQSVLELPSIEQQADQTSRPLELDTWRYKARNYIMYVPNGAESQLPPPKPDLVHQNTRLKVEPFDHVKNKETISAIAKSQDTNVSGKIGVDGVSLTEKSNDERYPLVSTPSPRPGAGPDQSPLMTWGQIEGTPFRLDGGDTPLPAAGAGCAYRMLGGGARERLALQLAESVARRRRPSPSPAPSSAGRSFRTSTERLASMSPAARKLAVKHLLSPRLRLTPDNMGILPASPKPSPSPSPSRRKLLVAARTPASPHTPRDINDRGNDTITDNLLNINVAKRERLKAQDFFK